MRKARTSQDGVILQSTAFTCVPAAGANIAAIVGVHKTEKELAQLCNTTRGTRWNLSVSAIRKWAMIHEAKMDHRDLLTPKSSAGPFADRVSWRSDGHG
jgi:hypothetical protein